MESNPPVTELAAKLTASAVRLLPGRDLYVGHLRTLPYGRWVKSGRLHLPRGFPLVDIMVRYPGGCSDSEKHMVQQHARVTMNAMIEMDNAQRTWPRDFWRHNHEVVQCSPHGYVLNPGKTIDEATRKAVLEASTANAGIAFEYLQNLSAAYLCELYEPERDEILLGLFSRLTRLYWSLEAEFQAAVIRPAAVSGVLTGAAAQNSPQYKAVIEFLEASRKKDLDAIINCVDPQSRETMAEMFKSNKAEALNMFASMAAEAAAMKLNKVTVRGNSAEIDFGDGKPASEPKQSLRVVLVKGEWKIAQ
jgi:hypothetical protein